MYVNENLVRSYLQFILAALPSVKKKGKSLLAAAVARTEPVTSWSRGQLIDIKSDIHLTHLYYSDLKAKNTKLVLKPKNSSKHEERKNFILKIIGTGHWKPNLSLEVLRGLRKWPWPFLFNRTNVSRFRVKRNHWRKFLKGCFPMKSICCCALGSGALSVRWSLMWQLPDWAQVCEHQTLRNPATLKINWSD